MNTTQHTASTDSSSSAAGSTPINVSESRVGLSVRLVARPGMSDALEQLLIRGRAMVLGEPQTAAWFAFRIDENTFGIFDTFADDNGRQAHLGGALAAEIIARASELLAEPPTIEGVDLLGHKVVAD